MNDVRGFDVVVLGGGAAGLFCAAIAGHRGKRVALLERNDRVGRKIKISGGGRCNFTNIHAGPGNYLSQNPNFCKSALARYRPEQFIELVESHGLAWHEKKLGQLFSNAGSQAIIDLLIDECRQARVEILTGAVVCSVRKPEGFVVETDAAQIEAAAVVVATGGLSFPKLGATGFGYDLARQFGHEVVEPRPGLVPFFCAKKEPVDFRSLSGVALPVRASANGAAFEEAMLFTHRGLSGPAILQVSSYRESGAAVRIDLMPGSDAGSWLRENRGTRLEKLLEVCWPNRFAKAWLEVHAPARPLSQVSGAELERLAGAINAWEPELSGDEGYPKAEVTLGGVDTRGLSSKTMESRSVPGLFFIGEIVDVTGWLGGYNFQWAWASAYAAGVALGEG